MGWLPVPQFSTHTTRHLCLTDLARMGWQLHAIATFAGHRSTESTLTYIHLSGGYPAGCRTSRPCGAELLQRLGNHLRAVVHAPHLRRAARGENALTLGDEPLDHRRCASCTARTSWPRAGKKGQEIASRAEGVGGDAVQLAPQLRRDGHRRRHGAHGAARAERSAQAVAGRGRAGSHVFDRPFQPHPWATGL